jgi:hypothetical protein
MLWNCVNLARPLSHRHLFGLSPPASSVAWGLMDIEIRSLIKFECAVAVRNLVASLG